MLIINFIQRRVHKRLEPVQGGPQQKNNIVNYMMLTYKNKDKLIKENYNRQWQTHTEKT